MFCHRSIIPINIFSFMLCFISSLVIFTTSTPVATTSATLASRIHLHALHVPKVGPRRENGVVLPWRNLLAEVNSSSLILAEERTQRRDPLNGFNLYTQGYNISNDHYWASVGFDAAPFFIIAAVWFLLFGLCLFGICLRHCCCSREPYGYSRICYALSLIFLILFTICAIAGCVVLYTGQGKLHDIMTRTLSHVIDQANVTSENLRNVSDYLAAARNMNVDSQFLPISDRKHIDSVQSKINSSSSTLATRTQNNSQKIQDGLDAMRLALIILAAVMLALAFLGFLFSIFGLQCPVYFLVVLGWFLVTWTFILCGVFLLLHNVVADTCVAMDDWVQNPTSKTALDDIIPCVDNATAQETLLQSKKSAYELINLVNNVLTTISNKNFPPQAIPLYYNQSGPMVPLLCNPLNSNYTDRQCAAGEVQLNNATEEWKSYVCEVSSSGVCTTQGRLTPTIYNQMASSVNVSYGLYRYGPFLVELEDCEFVQRMLAEINHSYCPGLRHYTEWIYVGLVMVSAAVMLSLIFWVIYARERRHRVYTKQFVSRGPPPDKAA